MRPACERCAFKLAPDGEAYICSYECSFCVGCAQDLDWICPNFGGKLVARPRRRGAG